MLCVSGKKTWGETTTQVVLFCDQPWVNNGRIPPMGTNDNGSKNCQLIIIPVKVKRKQVRPTKQQTRFVEEEKRIGILMPSTLNWTGLNGWVATRRYTNRICEKTKKVDRQTDRSKQTGWFRISEASGSSLFFSLSFDVNRKKKRSFLREKRRKWIWNRQQPYYYYTPPGHLLWLIWFLLKSSCWPFTCLITFVTP